MSNAALAPAIVEKNVPNNVIPFNVIKVAREFEQPKPKSSKARNHKGVHDVAGKSSEVYGFRTEDEIKAMMDVFNNRVDNANNEHERQLAFRNRCLFVVGINVGIRASDLQNLTYGFFYEQQADGSLKWKDFYTLQPKKTRKTKKFVKLFFNKAVRTAIDDYVEEYPFDSLNDYVFASRENNGSPLTTNAICRIIKTAAKDAGLPGNYGSHSLRKTFGNSVYSKAEDKSKALVVLSQIYNHSDVQTTRRYIGLTSDDMEEAFNSLDLGLEFL